MFLNCQRFQSLCYFYCFLLNQLQIDHTIQRWWFGFSVFGVFFFFFFFPFTSPFKDAKAQWNYKVSYSQKAITYATILKWYIYCNQKRKRKKDSSGTFVQDIEILRLLRRGKVHWLNSHNSHERCHCREQAFVREVGIKEKAEDKSPDKAVDLLQALKGVTEAEDVKDDIAWGLIIS